MFSLSGSTITQSGTDADLSGLQSISGVEWFTNNAGKTVYDLNTNSLQLVVNGDLQIDGDYEELHLNNHSVALSVDGSSAILRVGKRKDYNGQVRYSQGLSIVVPYKGAEQYDVKGIKYRHDSRLEWNGGVIMSGSACGSYYNESGNTYTAEVNAGTFLCTAPTYSAMFLRNDGLPSDVVVNDIILDHRDPSLGNGSVIFARNGQDVLSFDMRCGSIQPRYGSTTNSLLVKGAKFGKNTAPYDYEYRGGGYDSSQGGEFINLDVGTGVREKYTQGSGHFSVFQEVNPKFLNLQGNNIEGVKVYVPTTDSGNRINLQVNDWLQNGRDFTDGSYNEYFGTSGADGTVATITILTGRKFTTNNDSAIIYDLYSNGQTSGSDDFNFYYASYNEDLANEIRILKGSDADTYEKILLPDNSITESDKATVDAYTELETPYKLYDYAKSYLVDNFTTQTSTMVSRETDTIDAGNYNVVIDKTAGSVFAFDGTTITIKADSFVGNMVTTGVITLSNGATFDGTRTDTNGTVAPPVYVSAPNLIDGTRVQVYNLTQDVELDNSVISGTYKFEVIANATDGDQIRLRAKYQSGVNAKKSVESVGLFSQTSGVTFIDSQEDCPVYTAYGLDGSSITKFSADYANNEIDLILAENFEVKELFAWYDYILTTENGIRNLFNLLKASDEANIMIDTDVLDAKFDNTTSTNVHQTDNIRIYRKDGAYPVEEPTTGGGGIDVVWRDKIFIAESGTSGLTAEESAKLDTIPTAQDVWEYATRELTATQSGGLDENELHTALDNYANKDGYKADVSSLATQSSIDNLNDFDASTDIVSRVTLVDTTTTNTDMRGTDGVTTLDENGIHTALDNYINKDGYKADVSNLSADVNVVEVNGTAVTSVDDFKANNVDLTSVTDAIAALNDFNPASDTVARVTLVDTTTSNTDMRGTDNANTVEPSNSQFTDADRTRLNSIPTADENAETLINKELP